MNQDSIMMYSYEAAEKIMKKHSKSFFQAFSAIPQNRFRGVAAVYAFCRYVDDLVDEDFESEFKTIQQLNILETTILNLGEQEADESLSKLDWWPAFEETVLTFSISKKALLEQIEGQKYDLNFVTFDTLEDLEVYCHNVAGSVGAMLWPMLRSDSLDKSDQTVYLDCCYRLGIAMQITNILRDIGEDARERGRVYIPREILARIGWTTSEVINLVKQVRTWRDIPSKFSLVWEELAAISNRYYQTLDEHLDYFHPSCRLGILSAARIYHAIEDEIRNEHYNCITKRQYTNITRRLAIVNEAKKLLKDSI